MKQEEKELLIKDLCARLPYGVKGKTLGSKVCTLKYMGIDGSFTADTYHGWVGREQFIPYLRKMSTMTEEEEKEFQDINMYELPYTVEGLDWLNAHHFDYRDLIDYYKLALEATEDMYK